MSWGQCISFIKTWMYLATSSSWYAMSSKLWQLMRRAQQGIQNNSRISELLWRITPTRFMFLLPYVYKTQMKQMRDEGLIAQVQMSNNNKVEIIWFAHLGNQCVTSHSKAIACWSCGQVNRLWGGRSNTNKPENKTCKLSFSYKKYLCP